MRQLARRGQTSLKVAIIYYHSVGGPPPQTLSKACFESHLQSLQRLGIRTVTLGQLVKEGPQPKTAVLTFDDGLLDNYEVVFPLLQHYGMVGTFYCVPGYDQVTRWVHPVTQRWSDTPLPGYSIPFASVNARQRDEMARHGMEIGCHTYSHRKLTHLPVDQLHYEIVTSKDILEQQLGRPVETFCYPNGRYNAQIAAVVRQAGYLGACSTIPGYYRPHGNPFAINRFLTEDPTYFGYVAQGQAFRPGPMLRVGCKWLAAKTRLWFRRLWAH